MLKNIEKKILIEREFVFKAHHEKGYLKLRENQFAFPEHGIVHEPVANALDEQQGNEPVRIRLKKNKNGYQLTFQDNGKGLRWDNLESLHFIGKSNKRKNKEQFIGRFGMGLVGAFNSKLGVTRVEIKALVCGQPSRIIYDCSSPAKIPLWHMEVLDEDCHGFSITFFFPRKNCASIQQALLNFLRYTIVPINFNDRLYCVDPSSIVGRNDISIIIDTDPKVHYAAHPFSNSWAFVDDIHLYVRKMLVEKGDMYPMFVTTSGSKLPQNYYHYDTPYMQDESCMVISSMGEPTLGRDKLVRNDDFTLIRKNVETGRCRALVELFERSAHSRQHRLKEYADNMAVANIYAMRSLLAKHLQSDNSFMEKHGHCTDLLNHLIQYPLFSIFEGPERLSIKDILENLPMDGILFYAESMDAASVFSGAHTSPFVLKEEIYHFSDLWGGHEQKQIGTVLKPLLEAIDGPEPLSMEELLWNEKKVEELEKRGILSRSSFQIKHISSPDEDISNFLERLKTLLNQHWFRHSLVRFHPPKRIRLMPIRIKQSDFSGEIVAAVLNGKDGDPDELALGICMNSLPMRSILTKENGEVAALPIICHELTHHRRKLMDGEKEQNIHNDSFHFDRLDLESNVLKNCVLHLLGRDEELTRRGGMGMLSDISDTIVL